MSAAWKAGLAPVEPAGSGGDDPFSMFSGWESGQLLWLAILVPVAVLVFSVGSRRVKAQLRPSSWSRDRGAPGRGYPRDEAWRVTVERLEARAATAVAQAKDGPVRIEGVITRSMGNLGGVAGRECVWRNRAGAGPQTAVASELLIVSDHSGCCGVESLEQARVFAPVDKVGAHYESTSLYIGDRIEIIGSFTREAVGEPEDPTQVVYGTLGSDGRVDIRVLERPSPPAEPPAEAAPAPASRPSNATPEPSDAPRSSDASQPPAPEPEP